MIALFVRAVCYILLAAALANLSVLEASVLEGFDRFAELGFVESTQAGLLALCVLLCAWQARTVPDQKALATCMALAFAILFLRENDQVFEFWLPHGFWKWPALLVFIAGAMTFLRQRQAVLDQLKAFQPTLAFGVLLAGCTTLVFARFFGSSTLWERVMGDDYLRVVKQAAEEGTEVFALGLLTAGVVEMVIAGRAKRREP